MFFEKYFSRHFWGSLSVGLSALGYYILCQYTGQLGLFPPEIMGCVAPIALGYAIFIGLEWLAYRTNYPKEKK